MYACSVIKVTKNESKCGEELKIMKMLYEQKTIHVGIHHNIKGHFINEKATPLKDV